MSVQRVQRGNSATLTHTFFVDGTATNPSPDAATVTITRDDGTAIVTAAAATDIGTGTVSYPLTPAQTALLDILSVTWTATFGGQSQSFTDYVEIVGGFLFTIAEARAITPLSSVASFPLATIIDGRTLVEEALEEACGVAFVSRYRKETVDGTGSTMLVLDRPRVTAVRSVTQDGIAFGVSALALVRSKKAGVIYYPSYWTWGTSNYVIAYEHGYPYPPARIKQAALTLLKAWLVKGPVDDRTTSFSTSDGTFALATPGMRGSQFGIPEVDAAVQQYDERAMVA